MRPHSKVIAESHTILGHVPCVRCRYDLFGCAANSNCMECGVPIAASMGLSRLFFVPATYIRAIACGVALHLLITLGQLGSSMWFVSRLSRDPSLQDRFESIMLQIEAMSCLLVFIALWHGDPIVGYRRTGKILTFVAGLVSLGTLWKLLITMIVKWDSGIGPIFPFGLFVVHSGRVLMLDGYYIVLIVLAIRMPVHSRLLWCIITPIVIAGVSFMSGGSVLLPPRVSMLLAICLPGSLVVVECMVLISLCTVTVQQYRCFCAGGLS